MAAASTAQAPPNPGSTGNPPGELLPNGGARFGIVRGAVAAQPVSVPLRWPCCAWGYAAQVRRVIRAPNAVRARRGIDAPAGMLLTRAVAPGIARSALPFSAAADITAIACSQVPRSPRDCASAVTEPSRANSLSGRSPCQATMPGSVRTASGSYRSADCQPGEVGAGGALPDAALDHQEPGVVVPVVQLLHRGHGVGPGPRRRPRPGRPLRVDRRAVTATRAAAFHPGQRVDLVPV